MHHDLEELNPNQAAELIGETPDTLTAWRKISRHLPYLRHKNGTVTYLRRDLNHWLENTKPEYIVPDDWQQPDHPYIYPHAGQTMPKLMNRSQVARYLGVSAATPGTWIQRGAGPRCEVFANRAIYRKTDVDNWLMYSTEPEPKRIRKKAQTYSLKA